MYKAKLQKWRWKFNLPFPVLTRPNKHMESQNESLILPSTPMFKINNI